MGSVGADAPAESAMIAVLCSVCDLVTQCGMSRGVLYSEILWRGHQSPKTHITCPLALNCYEALRHLWVLLFVKHMKNFPRSCT
jgi:hypothetical protein